MAPKSLLITAHTSYLKQYVVDRNRRAERLSKFFSVVPGKKNKTKQKQGQQGIRSQRPRTSVKQQSRTLTKKGEAESQGSGLAGKDGKRKKSNKKKWVLGKSINRYGTNQGIWEKFYLFIFKWKTERTGIKVWVAAARACGALKSQGSVW